MKIHNKPKAPKRKKRDYQLYASCMTLDEILTQCRYLLTHSYQYTVEEADKLDYSDVTIETRWDYDTDSVYAIFTLPVSDSEFHNTQQRYKKKLAAYNKWYAENKDEIEAELDRRAQQKMVDDAARVQKQIDKLSKQLAQNHNKLKSLGV